MKTLTCINCGATFPPLPPHTHTHTRDGILCIPCDDAIAAWKKADALCVQSRLADMEWYENQTHENGLAADAAELAWTNATNAAIAADAKLFAEETAGEYPVSEWEPGWGVCV